MLITIAIPAFNEEKLLPSTLAAVSEAGEAFTERNWEMEVVVCDNNSTDRTGEIAEAAKARVVFEKHNQISRARNAAGNAAKGKWIIFIDADSQPSKALFEATAVAMGKKEIIGGGTTVKFEGGKLAPSPLLGSGNRELLPPLLSMAEERRKHCRRHLRHLHHHQRSKQRRGHLPSPCDKRVNYNEPRTACGDKSLCGIDGGGAIKDVEAQGGADKGEPVTKYLAKRVIGSSLSKSRN